MLLRAEVLTARDAIAGLQELAANADAFTSPDGRPGYLIASARARLQWNRREYDPDGAQLALALQTADPGLRFDALNLRAWMHAGQEEYRSQLHDLLECVRLYQQHGYRCGIVSIAQCLQSALALAWELHDPDAAHEAEAAFESVDWTPDIQVYRL